MAPSKRSIEEIRRKKKECERRRRDKIKSDPVLYEQAKAKERERYRKRKEEQKILPIDQMSTRKQRQKRKEWRKAQKKCRENRKCRERLLSRLREDSPPSSDIENDPVNLIRCPSVSSRCSSLRNSSPSLLENYSASRDSPASCSSTSSVSYQKKIGLKTAKRNRYIAHTKIKLQDKLISSLKKRVNALRMKMRREKKIPNVNTIIEKRNNEARALKKIHEKRIAVTKFFEDDENSRLCPGKRDVITRNKVKKQIRFLNDSIGNLYKKFKAVNSFQMSYATFCRYKPFWVLQANVAKRDTCLCILHENCKFIVQKLHLLRILQQCTIDEVAKSCVCDIKSDPCVLRQCAVCKDKVPLVNTFEDSATFYQKWMVKKELRIINGTEKLVARTIKDTIIITKVGLVKVLIDMIPKFLIHKQIITNQYEYIKDLKTNMEVGNILIHMDFSENYQTKYNEEIQSVHFGASRQQLTLHTVVAYYRDLVTDQLVTRSFCTISENLRHDACAVYAHILPVLHKINEQSPIHSLHVLSDAPSTQYRNKWMMYIFSNLLTKVFNLTKAEWSYSAPGHGKGAPDGVGGYTKRTADRIVSQGKDITNIETLFKVLCAQESNIMYMLIQDSDIAQIDAIVPKDLKPVRGTMNTYQVYWTKEHENSIYLRRLSCAKCDQECSHFGIGKYSYPQKEVNEEVLPGPSRNVIHEVAENAVISSRDDTYSCDRSQSTERTSYRELTEGNWAVIKFSCKKVEVFYIGQIVKIIGSQYLIKFLRKKKKLDDHTEFVWPQCEDTSEVNDEDIIITLPQPHRGRRNIYTFKNDWMGSFSNLR